MRYRERLCFLAPRCPLYSRTEQNRRGHARADLRRRVIGASIAYFLSRRGIEATVIEQTGLACAASGKSGGFLALDWCDGTPLAALARRSFALHTRLAEEIRGDWGYRRLSTDPGRFPPLDPAWLRNG